MHRPIRIGIVGMGFMGQTHLAAYAAAHAAGEACLLTAVCDADPARCGLPRDRVAGNIRTPAGAPDGAGVTPVTAADEAHEQVPPFVSPDLRTYAEPLDLIHDEAVDLVSICTPTDNHAALTVAAIQAGRHVLVEKPVALTAAGVQPVVDALNRWTPTPTSGPHATAGAATAPPVCMPAFCVRFWPGWTWLFEAARDGRYGRIRSARFTRLAAPPTWSPQFYHNTERTGGALIDLHIHDADFILALFGPPRGVYTSGTLDHVSTVYDFGHPRAGDATGRIDRPASANAGPAPVLAEGGWDHAPGFAFRMQFVVNFENATAEFDSRAGDRPLTITCQGETHQPELEPLTGYDGEVRAVLRAVRERIDGRTARDTAGPPARIMQPTMDDALLVARLLDTERKSLTTGTYQPFDPRG